MQPSAIIYTSKTGHTRQYALLLGKEIGLPVYSYVFRRISRCLRFRVALTEVN